jgi:redox-sensitive bicupin YhaK (pirin superfamily)
MPELIEALVEGRTHDLGGFSVRRVLPSVQRRAVGPFVFVDHIGPVRFAPGAGVAVRPHPHIGLATVTWLFEGALVHRDSLGNVQVIEPGELNWMTAGRGIAHSERSRQEDLAAGMRFHGMQTWVALPRADEDMAPAFFHHPGATLPRVERAGVRLDVIAGTAYGQASPVRVHSPTLYVAATLRSGSAQAVDTGHEERAVYVADGLLDIGGTQLGSGQMAVLAPGAAVVLEALADTRAMLLGGAPLDGPRHLWWNFVASAPERIERAKRDWREGRFALPPGETESIPLPER